MHSPALPAMLEVSRELRREIEALEQFLADQAEEIRRLRKELAQARKDRDRYKQIVAKAGLRAHSDKWGGPRRKPKHSPA